MAALNQNGHGVKDAAMDTMKDGGQCKRCRWKYRTSKNEYGQGYGSTKATQCIRIRPRSRELGWFTNPRMHLFHTPQCSIQNRNVHISVLSGALWDMEQVHSGICEIALVCSKLSSNVVRHSQTTPSAPSHPLRHPRSGVGPTHLWLLAD